MTYTAVPSVAAVTFTTNPVANTNTTHTVIGGALNVRIRIVAVRVLLTQNEPAANVFRGVFLGAGATGFWGTILQVGAVAADGASFPEPGVPCDNSASLTFVSTCTAASRQISVEVLYYADDQS